MGELARRFPGRDDRGDERGPDQHLRPRPAGRRARPGREREPLDPDRRRLPRGLHRGRRRPASGPSGSCSRAGSRSWTRGSRSSGCAGPRNLDDGGRELDPGRQRRPPPASAPRVGPWSRPAPRERPASLRLDERRDRVVERGRDPDAATRRRDRAVDEVDLATAGPPSRSSSIEGRAPGIRSPNSPDVRRRRRRTRARCPSAGDLERLRAAARGRPSRRAGSGEHLADRACRARCRGR